MMITTPFSGTETAAQRHARLRAITDWYFGAGAYDAAGSIGGAFGLLNTILSPAAVDREAFVSWAPKLNFINNPDLALPQQLFPAASGVMLDSSLLYNLTQDAAGSVPVTAPGQPIGRVLDISGAGLHAAQSVSAWRATARRRPASGARNGVRPTSEALSQWTSGGSVTVADNVPGGSTITAAVGSAQHTLISARDAGPANTDLTITLEAKAGTETVLILQPQGATSSNRWTYQVNLTTGVVTSLGGVGEATNAGALSEALSDGWWKITLKMKPQTTAGVGVALRAFMRTEAVWTAVGTETLQIRKVQIETGSTASGYQTVTSASDMAEAGFGSVWEAAFDGVDDRLLTPSIALASDEVTLVVAAAIPPTGTQYGVLRMVGGGGGQIGMVKRSDDRLYFSVGGSSVAAPVSPEAVMGGPVVWTLQGRISTSQVILRRNGVQVATSAASQGTGLYPTGQLEIGAWSGGQFGNASLSGLCLINKWLTPLELARVEKWAASKNGVVL